MKKTLILALLLALVTASFASNEPKSGAGIKLQMNLANVYGDHTEYLHNPDTRTCLSATGFVSFQFGNYFSLQPELSYMSRGATYNDNEIITKLDYFQFLFLMKFTIPTNSPVIPNFFFGPAGSLNITAKSVTEDDDSDIDDIRVYDAGPVFGAGVDINVGPGAIVLEGRYYMGLLKIYDYTNYDDNLDLYNKSLEIGLGYKFNL